MDFEVLTLEDDLSAVDFSRVVLVEESTDYPGELRFQSEDPQQFFARYQDWVSRYLVLNQLFNLPVFATLLQSEGWTVVFGDSALPILENYQQWAEPLTIHGFTAPGGGQLYPFQTFSLRRAKQRAYATDPPDRLYFAGWCAGAGKSLFAAAGAQMLVNAGLVDIVIMFTLMKLKHNLCKTVLDTTTLVGEVPDGTPAKRRKSYAKGLDFYVLNYDKTRFDFEELSELTAGKRVLWVLDEASKILTADSRTLARKRLDELIRASSATVWPMSASVVGTNPLRFRDVFNLAGGTANPLGNSRQFINRYADRVNTTPVQVRPGRWVQLTSYDWNLGHLQDVRHRVADRTQQVRKTDPGVREYFKGIQTITVPVQLSREDSILTDRLIELARAAEEEGNGLHPYYLCLRYLCNNPETLLRSDSEPARALIEEVGPNALKAENSAKLEMFLDQVEEIRDAGDKAVVFTQWTNLSLFQLSEALDRRSIRHVRHWGVGQTDRESQEAQDSFKADPGITLFLSSDAGAYGLNFQEARYVINYEPTYSWDILMQRSERINRADSYLDGLTSYVYVTEDSVEERVWSRCNERRELAAATLGTTEALSYTGGRSEAADLRYLIFGEK